LGKPHFNNGMPRSTYELLCKKVAHLHWQACVRMHVRVRVRARAHSYLDTASTKTRTLAHTRTHALMSQPACTHVTARMHSCHSPHALMSQRACTHVTARMHSCHSPHALMSQPACTHVTARGSCSTHLTVSSPEADTQVRPSGLRARLVSPHSWPRSTAVHCADARSQMLRAAQAQVQAAQAGLSFCEQHRYRRAGRSQMHIPQAGPRCCGQRRHGRTGMQKGGWAVGWAGLASE